VITVIIAGILTCGILFAVFSTKMSLASRGNLLTVLALPGIYFILYTGTNHAEWIFIPGMVFWFLATCLINCPNCRENVFELGEKPDPPIFYDPPKLKIRPNFPVFGLPFSRKNCTGCGLPTQKLFRDKDKLESLKSDIPEFKTKQPWFD